MKNIVVGIGGISRAGKTSLARLLKKEIEAKDFSVVLFHQDHYTYQTQFIPRIKDRLDWESPFSIDFSRFRNSLIKAKKHVDIVLAEGLFAFYEPSIKELYDLKLFIQIDKKTFLKRKEKDERWGKEPLWYIQHIWDSYLKYGLISESEDDYQFIDGKEDYKPSLINEISDRILSLTY